MIRDAKLIRQDRLVSVWQLPSGAIVRKGKRVPKGSPLTAEERRVYVEQGGMHACKAIMDGRGVKLAEAYVLLNKARYS